MKKKIICNPNNMFSGLLVCGLSPPPNPHTLSLSLLHKSIKPFLSAQVKFQATWAGKPKKGKKKVIKKSDWLQHTEYKTYNWS